MKNRIQNNVSLGSAFILIMLALVGGIKIGTSIESVAMFSGELTKEEPNALRKQVEKLKKSNAKLQRQLNLIERDYQIELEMKKNLSQVLTSLQDHNAELIHNMSLYEAIMGIVTPIQGGIQIKAFQLFSGDTPQTFRYSVVLSKKTPSQEKIQGAITMLILGKIGKNAILLPVKHIDPVREDGLGFSFNYLQELKGELALPKDFVPEAVQFKVKSDNGWPDLQQKFAWRVIH